MGVPSRSGDPQEHNWDAWRIPGMGEPGGLPSVSVRGDSPGKNTGVGCHALLQIFPTQGSKLHFLHGQVGSLSLAPAGKL